MSDFLKDLRNLPPEKPKVHTVCIEGKEVVVTLKKKIGGDTARRGCIPLDIIKRICIKATYQTKNTVFNIAKSTKRIRV